MHIILAVLGALAAAFWAFTHFMSAAREGREAVGELKGAVRRGKWNRRVDQRMIENLSDPREAAAILVFQIAAYDGAITDRQREHIVNDMIETFDADPETGQGLFSFARMAVGELNDAGNNVNKILRPIVKVCTPDEKTQLIELMERTAEIEGSPTDMQRRLIAEIRRGLSGT